MDQVERLITLFQDAGSDVGWKLDALLDLDQLRDRRVFAFLLRVVVSGSEAALVRQAALRQLRKHTLTSAQRDEVARMLVEIVQQRRKCDPIVGAWVAEILGEFVEIEGVIDALGNCAIDPESHFDLRYAAFTALERGGPSAETIAIFNALRTDDTLGRSAHAVLVRWRAD